MKVTIKEDCKSVLLDNGIEPPMLMDIEAFIQMAIESRNEMADKLQQAEADNAELLEGLKLCEKLKTQAIEVGTLLEGVHDNTWQKIQELNATYNTISNLINADHPGDALLKELEGLRRVKEAAAEFISKLQGCLDSKICNINECYICEHDNEPAIEALKQALADLEKEGTA